MEPDFGYSPIGGEKRGSRMQVAILVLTIFAMVFAIAAFLVIVYHVTKQDNDNNNSNNNSNNLPLPPMWTDLATSMQSMMDTSADPCDDFYQYACGTFLANTVLPPGVQMYTPSFDLIATQNMDLLYDILEKQQWPFVNDLFDSCMSVNSSSALTPRVQAIIQAIMSLNTSDDGTNLMTLLAQQHLMGSIAFFNIDAAPNYFVDNGLYYLMLNQGGLSLPPGSYTSGNIASLALTVAGILAANNLNLTNNQAYAAGQAVAAIETNLNNIYVIPVSFADSQTNVTYSWLTGLKWNAYVTALGLATPAQVMLGGQSFFAQNGLAAVIANSTGTQIRYYLLWHFIRSLLLNNVPLVIPSLKENERTLLNLTPFQKTAQPPRHMMAHDISPQESACLQATVGLMTDFVGHIFASEIVDKKVRDDIKTMTTGLENSFQGRLGGITWLDDAGRTAATFKVNNIVQNIGHPPVLNRYRKLFLDDYDYAYNAVKLSSNTWQYKLAMIGTPYVRALLEFDPTIVNAFYYPMGNSINFPAGILRDPMYNESFPRLAMFARMGYVVGHEMTHGFDNNGHLYDAFGAYRNIFDNQTEQAFDQQASCLVSQYSSYEVLPGLYIDGQQTLGENIADLGGVKNSFNAYMAWQQINGDEFQGKPLISFLNNNQTFWVHLAQTWCSVATDDALRTQVANDPHSPAKYRVIGPLSNQPLFSQAFNCPAGSKMNPTTKCGIW